MHVTIITVCLVISVIINIALLMRKRQPPRSENKAAKPIAWNQEAMLAFLEEADEKYMLAFVAKNIDAFAGYCTIPCAQEVQNRILYYEERNFGLPNKRKRKWTVMNAENDSVLLRKELTHARESKTHFTTGDDITEYWKIIYNSKFLVASIRV